MSVDERSSLVIVRKVSPAENAFFIFSWVRNLDKNRNKIRRAYIISLALRSSELIHLFM